MSLFSIAHPNPSTRSCFWRRKQFRLSAPESREPKSRALNRTPELLNRAPATQRAQRRISVFTIQNPKSRIRTPRPGAVSGGGSHPGCPRRRYSVHPKPCIKGAHSLNSSPQPSNPSPDEAGSPQILARMRQTLMILAASESGGGSDPEAPQRRFSLHSL